MAAPTEEGCCEAGRSRCGGTSRIPRPQPPRAWARARRQPEFSARPALSALCGRRQRRPQPFQYVRPRLGPFGSSARGSATHAACEGDIHSNAASRIRKLDAIRGAGRRPLFGTTGQEHAIFVEVDAIRGPQGEYTPQEHGLREIQRRRLPRANSVGVLFAFLVLGKPRNRCGHHRRAGHNSVQYAPGHWKRSSFTLSH